MSDDLDRTILTLVRAEVGDSDARIVDRSQTSSITTVLDIAFEQLDDVAPVVVWVDGGRSFMFHLSMRPPVVVFSTRVLELCAFVRRFLIDPAFAGVLDTVSDNAVLTMLADDALHARLPRVATRLFVESILDRGIFIPHRGTIDEMREWSVDEGFVTVWFFGLLHELGHIWTPPSGFDESWPGLLTPDGIDQHIRSLLEDSAEMAGADLLSEDIARARANPRGVLSFERFRREVRADIFGTAVLLRCAIDLLGGVDPETFTREVVVAMRTVQLMQQCHAAVATMRTATPTQESADEWLAWTFAMILRQHAVADYLAFAFAKHTDDDLRAWGRRVGAVTSSCKPAWRVLDTSVGRGVEALRAAVVDDDVDAILAGPAQELRSDRVRALETLHFCDHAVALRSSDASVDRLRQIVV